MSEEYEKISDEVVEQVLRDFDFEKIKRVMDFLNWKWSDGKVPTVTQIFFVARGLLMKVASGECWGTGTGGLYAIRNTEQLSLRFHAEDSMASISEE